MSNIPNKVEELIKRAISFEQKGMLREAEEILKIAMDIDPTNESTWIALGMIQQDLGNLPLALSTFLKASEQIPQSSMIWNNLGTMYLQVQGMESKAEDSLRKALDINPNFDSALFNLSGLLMRTGRLDDAEKVVRKAVLVLPDNHHAWANLSLLLVKKGDCVEALKALQRAKNIDADDSWVMDVDKHLQQICGRLSTGPKIPAKSKVTEEIEVLMNRAANLLTQRKLGDAEVLYREVISIDASISNAWGMLGVTQKEQGRLVEAIESFERSLELDPNNAVTLVNYGSCLRQLQRIEEAEKALKKATSILPQFSMAWFNLGNLLSDSDRPLEAERAYRNALKIEPHNRIFLEALTKVRTPQRSND